MKALLERLGYKTRYPYAFDLFEKKDHLVKKLKNLSSDEKGKVIDFFKKKPNLEGKINWNDKELKFSDFENVMMVTKTEKKKKVKESGLSGLKQGIDYIQLEMPETEYNPVIPLNYDASVLMASRRVGGSAGSWCIAYQKDDSYWKSYVGKRKLTPIYFIGDGDKYAVMVNDSGKVDSIWDKNDNDIGAKGAKALGFGSKADLQKAIKKNVGKISKARKIIEKDLLVHWFEKGLKNGSIKVKDAEYEISGDYLTWKSGTWEKGTWVDGHWVDGIWEDGTWEKGIWKYGIWEDGTWEDGIWKDGNWAKGTWEDGNWQDGSWINGTWENGFWYDGTWINGFWERGHWGHGVWENGVWEDGIWENGIWENGIWMTGYWKGGTWEKGKWITGKGKPDNA